MADEKIYPDMPDIGAPGSADVLPIVRPGDTTNYSITMDGIAAYAQGALIPGAGLVYSTGSAFDTATMGDGVAFASGTMDNTGVLSVGTLTGAVGLGANLTTTGGTLNATGFGSMSSWVAGTNLSGGTITNGATASLSPAITITDSAAKIVLDRNTGGTLDTLNTIYLHVVGADGVAVKEVIDSFDATPQYTLRRANGTRASKTTIQNGDTLGIFGVAGYDGSAYSFGGASSANMQAGVAAVAVQNWTTAAHGVQLLFRGIASGSTTVTSFGTLNSSGMVLSGGTIVAASNSIVVGGNFTTAGVLSISPATWTTNNLVYASGTTTLGQAVVGAGLVLSGGTLATSASPRVFDFSFDIGNTGTFVADTYKSKMPNAGTVLFAYAIGGTGGTITAIPQIFAVTSGTIGAGSAITGIGTLTSGGSLTVEVAGTATAANTFAAGDYLGFVGAISSGTPVGTKINITGTYT